MAITGFTNRFQYSGAANNASAQNDPDLSLGGANPDNVTPSASECYIQSTLTATSTRYNQLTDSSVNGVGSEVAVGDWVMMVADPVGGEYAKVTAIDTGTGVITLDRALPGLPLNGTRYRACRAENLFPHTTAAQVSAGLVDHRMIYYLNTAGASETNFRFWIKPIKPNGCDLEIMASGGPNGDRVEPSIADGEEDPFSLWGNVDGQSGGGVTNSDWTLAEKARTVYSRDDATPHSGSEAIPDENYLPIWLRRSIPAGASPGECVFALYVTNPTALAQDAAADPADFNVGFIISWTNPQPTYQLTVGADRTVYTRGAARIIGTVKDDFGVPLEGVNAYFELVSGPGTLTTDLDGVTDEAGRIYGLYEAPNTLSTDPVIRLRVPTNPEV